jgi:hypothetical protein
MRNLFYCWAVIFCCSNENAGQYVPVVDTEVALPPVIAPQVINHNDNAGIELKRSFLSFLAARTLLNGINAGLTVLTMDGASDLEKDFLKANLVLQSVSGATAILEMIGIQKSMRLLIQRSAILDILTSASGAVCSFGTLCISFGAYEFATTLSAVAGAFLTMPMQFRIYLHS